MDIAAKNNENVKEVVPMKMIDRKFLKTTFFFYYLSVLVNSLAVVYPGISYGIYSLSQNTYHSTAQMYDLEGNKHDLSYFKVDLKSVTSFLPHSISIDPTVCWYPIINTTTHAMYFTRVKIEQKLKKLSNSFDETILDYMTMDYNYSFVISNRQIIISKILPIRKVKYAAKHILLANFSAKVRYAGEMWLEVDKSGNRYIVMNNNSGTYKPKLDYLKQAGRLIAHNLGIPVKIKKFKSFQ